MNDRAAPCDHRPEAAPTQGITAFPGSPSRHESPTGSGRRASRMSRLYLAALGCLLASPLAFGLSFGPSAESDSARTLTSGDETAAAVPGQWIAKQYTELFGRAPDTTEWRDAVSLYQGTGSSCDAGSLKSLTDQLTVNRPFESRYPQETRLDRAVRAAALIRAVYGREPVEADWERLKVGDYVAGEALWRDVYYSVFHRPEFTEEIAGKACAEDGDYGFAHGPALDLRARAGHADSRTREELQADLEAAAPAGTVTLKQGEVIRLADYGAERAESLVVPSGVTLTTAGVPETYARMGRIVGGGAERVCNGDQCGNTGLVVLEPGATLSHVWVDGQASGPGGRRIANVEVEGSRLTAQTRIAANRLSGPAAGGAAARLRGFATTGEVCRGAQVTANLITGYATRNRFSGLGEPLWTSGIAVFCGDATVTANQLVDISDYGILLHGIQHRSKDVGVSSRTFLSSQRTRGAVQASEVSGNRVLSAGVSAQVALGADPTGECLASGGDAPIPCIDVIEERDFRGAMIQNNTFWTSPNTHFDVGLLAGGAPRWGNHASPGYGLAVFENDTGFVSARVNMGISVLGMHETMLSSNSADFELVDGNPAADWRKCPQVEIGVGNAEAESMPVVPGTAVEHGASAHDCLLGAPPADGLERLAVSDDGNRLVGAESGRTFVPWGYNYGQKIEFWWDENWDKLVTQLRDMRKMGANTVNVNWELRQFIAAPSPGHPHGTPRETQFERLEKFVELAEQTGIYVVMTGADIRTNPDGRRSGPDGDWYSNRSESERWRTQRLFWENVAQTVGDSGVVAWYDLMNEPHVPREPTDSWCWGGMERFGLCFIQNITRDRDGRTAKEISGAWMAELTGGIRDEGGDEDRLISVGVIFCAGAFHRDHLEEYVDFVSVHKYPNEDTLDWFVRHTKNCKPDNGPVIVQETFTLPGDGQVIEAYIERSRPEARGWIGQWVTELTPAQIVRAREELKEKMANDEVDDHFEAFMQLIRWGIQLDYHRMFLRVSGSVQPHGVGIAQP